MNLTYTKPGKNVSALRIQILETPSGVAISHAADASDHAAPADLRGFQGGWDLYPQTYKAAKGACSRLEKDGWTLQA